MTPRPKPELTLYVPGLLGPPTVPAPIRAAGMRNLHLEALLSRAVVRDQTQVPELEERLFQYFGHAPRGDADRPVAPVTRLVDAERDESGWWVRADPVHLRADMSRLVLFDADCLAIHAQEARTLAHELNAQLGEDSGVFEAPHPRRWYLRPREIPAVRTRAPSAVLGAHIEPAMPRGADGPAWHRLMNEIQMVLHASAVNQARESRGEPAINGLWLWGGGRLPDARPAPWVHTWSDDPLCAGLARLGRVPHEDIPDHGRAWLERAREPGAHLVALTEIDRHCRVPDLYEWQARLQVLERDWFQPLHDALARGAIESVTVDPGTGVCFQASSGTTRRWWRRRRGLATFMKVPG